MIQEEEYSQRRKKFAKKLKSYSVAVFLAATPKTRSNDTEYPYRQDSNFYYLSGFKEDNAALVFVKKRKKTKVVLFVQKKDPTMELWTGKRLGVDAAQGRFDVDEVHPFDTLQTQLAELKSIHHLYYDFARDEKQICTLRNQLKGVYEIKDAAPIVAAMRLIKSPSEIALIKTALSITKKAHHEAMRCHKELRYEYEVQAKFEYIFKKNGAYNDAYTTIVAGGDNANTLHYIANDKRLKKGSLVLIDAGCEYEYYASDITRTIPVSGRFTQAQKEVYQLVLDVEKRIISMVQPGVLRSKLQKKAERMLCEGMVELGILQGDVKKLLKKQKHKQYFPHGIGHFMGLDVHDQNPYKDKNGKEIPLQAGMVLTIEPGLYLPQEDTKIPKKYRGIGIRIEDNILVTKNGFENLSAKIAKEIVEIESYAS